MNLDGFFFNALVREVAGSIQGSRVEDAYNTGAGTIILRLRSPGQTLRLAIAMPAPAFFLAEQSPRAKGQSAFAQTLKKHLTGLFCLEFSNPPFDRVATLALAPSLGEGPSHFLHFEIMGRQRDLILTADSRILASTRAAKREGTRALQAGDRYLPPPTPAKAPPTSLTGPLLRGIVENSAGPVEKALCQAVLGVGPLLAKEIWFRAGRPSLPLSETGAESIVRQTAALAEISLAKTVSPTLSDQGPYWLRLSHLDLPQKDCPTLSAALASWQQSTAEQSRSVSLRQRLTKTVKTAANSTRNTLAKQEQELERAAGFARYRQIADTLFANLASITKGQPSVTLANVHDGQLLTIALDPRLSASANANRYYKQYHKYKGAVAIVSSHRQTNREQLAYLESLEYSLAAAESLADLEEVLAEMTEAGLSRRRTSAKPSVANSYLRYASPRGTPVAIGKNNRQNDELLRTANKEHFWLHCRNSPGGHVILASADPAADDLAYAASLAAWFSDERAAPKVEVAYTRVKYVKKIPGAKPGRVTYTNYRSLFIVPGPPRAGAEGQGIPEAVRQ